MKNNITLASVFGVLLTCQCLAQKPAFDAASVKLEDPSVRPTPGPNGPGRFSAARRTMGSLMGLAFNVPADQISGRQSWMTDGGHTFEITATMPPNTTRAELLLMLQNLLAERFHLAIHHETQDFPGYDLVVAKDGPKLKESKPDPAAANPDPTKPLPAGKDGFPVFPPGPRTQNMNSSGAMRQKYQEQPISNLVADLPLMMGMALGSDSSTRGPRVTDKTGLTGKYDFLLEFRTAAYPRSGAPPPLDASPADAASDPQGSGLPSVFDALVEQLGLRLVKAQDVPLDVIVIDHVDRVPTSN